MTDIENRNRYTGFIRLREDEDVIVYVDLLFLVNVLIDGALLYATARIRRIRFRLWRLCAAAAIGGAYVVMLLLPALSGMQTFVFKFAFSALMLLTAFGYGGRKTFWRNLGSFYLIGFVAAGGIYGLHAFFSSGGIMNGIWLTHSGGIAYSLPVGIVFVLAAMAAVLFAVVRSARSVKERERLLRHTAQVSVTLGDCKLSCTGLVDTGNHLYDPLTKTPVMVMETSLWKEWVPASWLPLIRRAEPDLILSAPETEAFRWRDRLRLVPYRGVGRSMQFMLAIRPDEVIVTQADRTIASDRVLIGFDAGALSSDGSYQAIIHPMLMET
ncbi:sigma-E processing peptidase SpoIIGA [Paenibacillus cymbidii]|uniref:sigma-E processing peptidase SpoIIGA n=1 Tax=Paenibacillus cymbidii TaxID=1639034 RepID=UPI001F2A28BE|nr:sigma-E processing peptidase SpoIIGA [Paenibacillus cymbidii]